MSNRAELLKSIIKNTSDVNEDAALDKYLLSRGINPQFATKDQKVAHSKTGQFIKWKKDHITEGISMMHTPTQQRLHALKKSHHVSKEIRVADGHKQLHPQNEAVDKKDTVTLDIPLLIRVLELAREDIKTDMDLHRVVEKLINIRNKGMLTMKDYNYIARIHEDIVSQVSVEVIEEAMRTPKDEKEWNKVAQSRSEVWRRKQLKKIDENHIAVAMGKELDDEGSMVMNQLDQMERSINMLRSVVKDPKMQLPGWVQSKVTLAADYIETVAGYMSSKNEEVESVAEGQLDEYGDTAKGQKMLTKVHKRAVNRTIRADDKNMLEPDYTKRDLKTVRKNQTTADRAWDRMSDLDEQGVVEGSEQVNEIDMSKTLAAYNKGKPAHAQAKVDTRTVAQRKAETDAKLAAQKKPFSPVKMSPASKDDMHKQIAKSYSQHKPGQYVGDSVEHDDATMVEAQSAAVRWQKALEAAKKKREEEEKRNAENAKRALTPKSVQEAAYACEMSKSARIIKSIYKKQGVTEETYDHEKEDKSVSSYGKKPKMAMTKKEASFGENVPTAAAVLKGGTTLTGQTRDTVEIDPTMRKRPGPDISGKTK